MNTFFRGLYILVPVTFLAVCITSCEWDSQKTLFRKLEIKTTNINFSNQLEENDSINILEYLSAYNGAGIGAGDFNNDGFIDLYFVSNQQSNKLYINHGNFEFEDVSAIANVAGLSGINRWSNGVTLVDINNDNWLDIYVCMMHGYLGLEGVNQLFINNGDGTFTEKAIEYSLNISSYAQHAAFFDFDRDGDLDMYLLNQAVHTKASFDAATGRRVRDPLAGDKLLENINGKYIDISEKAGIYGGAMGYGLAVSTGDINDDGWPDIYVSNDFHENDYLYYNRGDGTFKENIGESMGHLSKSSMGNDIGDIDNDGDIDIMTLDMKPTEEVMAKQTSGIDPYSVHQYKMKVGYHYQLSRNMLQKNVGPLLSDSSVCFSEIGQLVGVAETDWSWSVLMADLDNDGLKDLYVTNGIPKRPNSLDYRKLVNENTAQAEATPASDLVSIMPEGKTSNIVFKNSGERFVNVSSEWGLNWAGYSNGAVTVDLDNDGDLDIVLNNLNATAEIFNNQTSELKKRDFLKLSLSKNGNRHIESDVKLVVTSGSITQFQELKSTSGWLSSYVGDHLFGLDVGYDSVEVKVIWPDKKEQHIQVKQLNRGVELKYENATLPDNEKKLDLNPIFSNISDSSGISFIHKENNFTDFYGEPLIPHFLSTQGPQLAVGDVNGDSVEDFFIGGAKGQHGAIFLGSDGPVFREGKSEQFESHKNMEDAGAEMVDVDNDGDLDLYVVSGGGEVGKTDLLLDRLYFNDGQGNFTYNPDALPNLRNNGSCVVAMDVNSDGYEDLFIGGRSIPGVYGQSGESKLFVNDGHGYFNDSTSSYLPKDGRIGMVTDAAWIAQSNELVVVGDWMPISVFKLHEKKFVVQEISNTSGWWNTLYVDDLDNDGDADFLIGNIGLNTGMTTSKENPVELFVKDFDSNLSSDPIMAYHKNGRRWVYPGLDELATQMPAVRNVFTDYSVYASKTFDDIFPPQLLENSLHFQVQTLSSVMVEKTAHGYKVKELPLQCQASPIFGFAVCDFDQDGFKDILAVGNLYDNQLSIGKLDASYGAFLKGKGELEFEYIEPIKSGIAITGEARNIKIISTSEKNRLILISRNNDSVCLFK